MENKTWIWVVVIVLLVFVVYAFGLFGNESLFSPFDATVSLANSPPSIVAMATVLDVDESNNPDASSSAGDVQPRAAVGGANGLVYSVVKFIVEDPDCPGDGTCPDLVDNPSDVIFGSPTGAGSEIAVRITSPQNGIRCGTACRDRDAGAGGLPSGVSADCSGSTCVGDGDCPDSTVTTIQRAYTCYVEMQYYDEPSVTAKAVAGDFWALTLYIEDVGGNSDTETSGSLGSGSFPADEVFYMDYLTVGGMDIDPAESLTWANIDVTLDDRVADDNNGADGDGGLTFWNRGNLAVTGVDLRPQRLQGDTDDDDTALLEVASMSVDDAEGGVGLNACDNGGAAIQLIANTPTGNIPGVTVDFNADDSDSDEIYFCIWDRLDNGHLTGSSTDQSYSADDTCDTSGAATCDSNGENWEVTETT
jgi:hypothetical protein